jgi:hypothetical protein
MMKAVKNVIGDMDITELYSITTGKGKALPVHSVKAYRRSRSIIPLILNFGNGWR